MAVSEGLLGQTSDGKTWTEVWQAPLHLWMGMMTLEEAMPLSQPMRWLRPVSLFCRRSDCAGDKPGHYGPTPLQYGRGTWEVAEHEAPSGGQSTYVRTLNVKSELGQNLRLEETKGYCCCEEFHGFRYVHLYELWLCVRVRHVQQRHWSERKKRRRRWQSWNAVLVRYCEERLF